MTWISRNLNLKVEYFDFEQDFMEDNIRCIPMIVRFKLDACGIKLKLKEWSKMSVEQREDLATLSVDTENELNLYKQNVEELVFMHTGKKPTVLEVQDALPYMLGDKFPSQLLDKLSEQKMNIEFSQWKSLSPLQRYALLKLSRPGHENRNFPKAMKEFGLI